MKTGIRPEKLITASAIALLCAITILVTYYFIANVNPAKNNIMSNGSFLGGDFIAFYTGGEAFAHHRDKLYDLEFQKELRAKILPESTKALGGELPFVYPPLVALLASIFALFKFKTAYLFWVFCGAVISFGALYYLTTYLGWNLTKLPLLFLICTGYIPYYLNSLIGGQMSWTGVAIFSVTAVALLRKNFFLAGLFLAIGYYKPPLFLLAAMYLTIRCPKEFLFGEIAGAIVLTGLTLFVTGVDVSIEYLQMVTKYTYGQELMQNIKLPPAAGMGIYALLTTLLPSSAWNRIILAVLYGVVLVVGIWRRKENKELDGIEVSFLTTASIGLSLQCINYDLALLLIPFLIFWNERKRLAPHLRFIIGLIIVGFYFEFLFRAVNVGNFLINASSLLFITLLAALFIAVIQVKTQPVLNS